jgi:hypothetical protein
VDQTKITIKLQEGQAVSFSKQLDRLFIKRDGFFNKIVKDEVDQLAEEMGDRRLSERAHRYVSAQLKKMGTKTVNIVVEKETAESLNAVVKRSNMVRDAFMNRLILFLRSPRALLDYLDLPNVITGSAYESLIPEFMATSPLQAMEQVINDPLHYLRTAAMDRFGTGLYLLRLPSEFDGFSCFLDDASIPGTKEYAAAQEEAAKNVKRLLKKLDQMESDAFAKPPSGTDKSRGKAE